MNIATVGNIASIATLVTFLFYTVGKVVTIIRATALMSEDFGVSLGTEFDGDYSDYYDVDGGGEVLSITSAVPIVSITLIPVLYDGKKDELKDGPTTTKHKLRPKRNSRVFLRMSIPEGIPNYRVKIRRFDGTNVKFYVGYNGRSGGMSPVEYKISHTFWSVLYYIFQ